MCVRSANLLLGYVGGSLILLCIIFHYHILLWCVWALPTCSWGYVGVSLMRHFIIVYYCGVCEVCRLALGVMSVGLSYIVLFIVMCVRSADLLLGCVGGFLTLLIVFMMCVRSANLLLGYVSGSLKHHFNGLFLFCFCFLCKEYVRSTNLLPSCSVDRSF